MNNLVDNQSKKNMVEASKKEKTNEQDLYKALMLNGLFLILITVLLPLAGVFVGALVSSSGGQLAFSGIGFWSSVVISVALTLAIAHVLFKRFLAPVQQVQNWLAEGATANFPAETLSKNKLGELLVRVQEQRRKPVVQQGKQEGTDELAAQTAVISAQLTATIGETSQSTGEISASIQQIASGTDEQDKAIHDINATAGEIFFSLTEIAESIKFVSVSSKMAITHSNNGNEVVEKITQQMDRIRDQVNHSITVVNDLGQKTNQIGDILSLITDISNQTNLLALNAAIEAARAGEHGRGFSVVADEVRKLAEQTNQATGKIQNLIKEIQEGTSQAVEVIQLGGDSVNEGVTLNQEVGKVFKDIYSNVDEVDEFIQDLSVAIQDVTANMNQVSTSISNVSEITSQKTGSLQNIAAVIEELNASMQEISASATVLSNIAHTLQQNLK